MSMHWCRLWHDLPTDPKFRTIAKAAKQPLVAVIAIFIFKMADASANATERNRTQANAEDIASALDLDIEQVTAIEAAMQGRVLDGNTLTGWDKRNPKREDNSADRSKTWRETQKAHADSERNRTQPNAKRRLDKDKDKDKEREAKPPVNPPATLIGYGEHGLVRLTETEHGKLKAKFNGKADGLINELDNYIGKIGAAKAAKKYASHYFVILSWGRSRGHDTGGKSDIVI